MTTATWIHSIRPGTARFRWCGVVLAALTIAQLLAWWAPTAPAEASTSIRTRLSTGVPDAVAPELAAVGRTLHSVWSDAGLPGAPARGVGYRRSLDGGTTWSPMRQLDLHDGKGFSEWPRIAADGDTVVATWSETTSKQVPDAGNRQIWAAVSSDAGATFTPAFRVDEDRADSEMPLVAVRGSSVWIAWGDLDRDVYVATSHDHGATFEVHQLEDGWGYPLSRDGLAVDGDTVAVTWMRDEGERNKDIDVRVSRDGGDTWDVTIAIADTPQYVWDWYPVVAATDGTVHVVWAGSDRRLVRSSTDGGRTFGAPVDLGPGPGLASVTARPGLVAVAWSDVEGKGVRVATSSGFGDWSQSFVAGPHGSRPDIEVPRPVTEDRPRARFTWTMPERFGMDRDGDGLVDEREDAGYITPPFWTVSFDGCASTAGADDPDGDLRYAWTLDGEPFGPDDCRFDHQFTEEGEHTVLLEVTRASGKQATTSHVVDVEDQLIFSLGDSVASGEGNPDIPGSGSAPWPWSDNSVWQDRQCNRTAKAGPALAAAEIERRDPRQSVTFVHLACSGATVWGPDNSTGGILSPYEGINPSEGNLLDPQIDQLQRIAGGREVDAVFVSIGANDLAFSKVVAGCIANFGCYEDDEDIKADFDRRLADLPGHYERLAYRLEQLGIDDVYITEYFDPTVDHTGAWNLSCTANLGQAGISDSETRWAADYVMGNLNGSVRAAAARHGWHYVGGIASQFHRHGYCAEDPYVVQLGASFMDQSDKNGAFHPNNAGHEIYGRRIADEFAGRRQPPVDAPDAVDPVGDDWAGDLYLAWGDRNVMVTTLRSDGGAATPVRTVDVSQSTGTYGTRFTSLAATEHGAYVAWDESEAIDPATYLGHWHAYAAPAVQAPPDLALTSATLVQGPADADFLVAGKATAVHAEVVSTLRSAQTVYVRYEVRDAIGALVASGKEPVAVTPGHNDLYLRGQHGPLLPTEGSWWVDVQIDPDGIVHESDETNNGALTPELAIRTSRDLRTLFVPVGGTACATATGLASASSPWLHGVLPVADGALTQHTDCGYAMPGSNASEQGIAGTLTTLDGMALLSGYDTAVGVVPSGWLQAGTGGAVGLGLYGDSEPAGAPAGGMLVEQGQGPSVIAHELGHNFGLDHTVEQPAPGYWVGAGTEQDGVDWMDAFTQQKPWVGSATWATLMERFQLTHEQGPVLRAAGAAGADRSLVVRGSIAPDGTLDVPAWYQSAEAPDVALGSTADLVLEYHGSGGYLLATAGVHASTLESYRGHGLAGWASFGARVPWVDGTARLVLRDVGTGSVLVDREVTASAPTVSLHSPSATTWAAIGGDLEVRWTAGDPESPDGAELRAALLYSTDGGATFKPIAIDLEGTEAIWAMGDHLAGKPVQIRLDVTDGVRTTSVLSETFTVGGTPPSGQPRLAVIRNVQGEHGEEPWTQLHTMLPDGSDLRLVPTIGDNVSDPVWSPDGQRIAFATDGDPDAFDTERDVYVVRPDGSDLVNLTPPMVAGMTDWRYACPQWHPDGSKVLVHVSRRDDHSVDGLAWAASDGSGLTRVASGMPYDYWSGCPRLSRDGTRVAFAEAGAIHVLDLTTGERTQVIAKPPARDGYADDPFWTPDGSTVIATLSTGASTPGYFWGLVKAPADGSGTTTTFLPLTNLKSPIDPTRQMNVEQARFTPDGNKILFHAWDGRVQYTEGWRHRLSCSMNADATGISCLQDERLSALGGGFLEADLAPGEAATPPPPPPPWTDPAPVVVPPAGDLADAGGPYAAVEDEPVRLDAGASGLAVGGVPLAEWDLDGDGEFDDAAGLHTTATFADAGDRTVQVRVTAADGRIAVAATTATVSSAPPSVLAPAPITAVAGRSYRLEGASFVDPGTAGHVASASWGDGSVEPLHVPLPASGPLDGEHTWTVPGSYELAVTVCDEGTDVCATSSTTVTVVAGAGGAPPVAVDSEVRTASGTPVTVALSASDPDGDALERAVDRSPAHGRILRVDGDAATYLPDSGFAGVDSFTWTASDRDGASEPATVTIVVGNTAPIAGEDEIEVEAGDTVLVESATLLANDVDPDGDDLRVVGAYAGAGMPGQVERTDEGVRVSTPDDATGTTTFEYAVADGNGGLALATVTVVVVGGSDPTTTTTTPTTPPSSTTPTTAPPGTDPSTTTTAPPNAVPSTTTTVGAGGPVTTAGAAPGTSAAPTTAPQATADGGGERSVGAAPSSGTLPATGGAVLPLVIVATVLVLVGSAAVRARRSAATTRSADRDPS